MAKKATRLIREATYRWRAFYYPHGRTVLCEECGASAAAEF